MYIIRSLFHRAKRHFFPKTMQASLEIAQLDINKYTKLLTQAQKQGLEKEAKILSDLHSSMHNDITHLTEVFQFYAIKSHQQLEEINNNLKKGLSDISSGLNIINRTLLETNSKLINQISDFKKELSEILKNPEYIKTNESLEAANLLLEQYFLSKTHSIKNLNEAIELYEKALINNPMSVKFCHAWLELAYAYGIKGETDKALNAFEKSDQYSELGVHTNHFVKNEALLNISQIYINQQKYQKAYDTILDSLNPMQYSEDIDTILILKGIVEVKFANEKEGINQLYIALSKRPDLISVIYYYSEENTLSVAFVHKLLKYIVDMKRNEIYMNYKRIENILKDFEYVWRTYPTSEFTNIKKRIESVLASYKAIIGMNFLQIHGINEELIILTIRLAEETKSIINNKNIEIENNIKNKEIEIANYVQTFKNSEGDVIRRAENKVKEIESELSCLEWVVIIILTVLSLIYLDFLIKNWFYRLITTLLILGIIVQVVKNFTVRNILKDLSNQIENLKGTNENNIKSSQSLLNNYINEKNKINTYINKISILHIEDTDK